MRNKKLWTKKKNLYRVCTLNNMKIARIQILPWPSFWDNGTYVTMWGVSTNAGLVFCLSSQLMQ